MKQITSRPLVVVAWVDSLGCSSSWEPVQDDAKCVLSTCRSVGWLVYDGPEGVVLVPHVAVVEGYQNDQGVGDMAIPRPAILSMVALQEDPNP